MVGKPSESSTGHGENEELGLDSSSEDCEGVGVNIPSANCEEPALLVPLSSRLHAWLHLCSGPAVTSIWILGFTGKLSSKFVPSSAATQQEKSHMEMAKLAGISGSSDSRWCCKPESISVEHLLPSKTHKPGAHKPGIHCW